MIAAENYGCPLLSRWLLPLLALAGGLPLAAQPIPVPERPEAAGQYIFTVYTPAAAAEATLWRCGTTEMTTHRLRDTEDSTELALTPVSYPSLRTYVHAGAAAGAVSAERAATGPVIKELMAYPTLLSPEQRQLTESYLAIKHGLTLSQRLPVNYLAPAAAGGSYPVWTATAAPEFRHRILGLARDAASHLSRSEGYSVLAPELLGINWHRQPDTTAYLLMADDGAPTAVATASADGRTALQRRWRVEVTGKVPATTLRFAPRAFFAQPPPGAVWQLHLTHANGSVSTYPATESDGEVVFPDVSFLPGASHFTLSLPAATTTALPRANLRLSPNPVRAGQTTQLRAVLETPTALTLSVFAADGRLVEERYLPATTHHLTEVSLPAPGSYTLHLRQRLGNAPLRAITLIVQ